MFARIVAFIYGVICYLLSCRPECDPRVNNACTSVQIVPKDATPTYLTASAGGPRPTERLTWLVEFDITAGADYTPKTPCDPTLPPEQSDCDVPDDAKLVIEFTIQAK